MAETDAGPKWNHRGIEKIRSVQISEMVRRHFKQRIDHGMLNDAEWFDLSPEEQNEYNELWDKHIKTGQSNIM